MFNIKIFNQIADKGLSLFTQENYKFNSNSPDAIILRSHQLAEEELTSNLKAIGRAGAGTNNIPIAKATALGIPVFNTPGANANAVKELVLAGLIMASRPICQAWQYVENLKSTNLDNDKFATTVEQAKKQFKGFELPGKSLGVIGLGAIGVKVANAARQLGMQVIGYDPKLSIQRAWELSSEVKQANSLNELLKNSQFISLHVPLSKETENLINAENIKLLPKNSVILNFARKELVDENAVNFLLKNDYLHAYINDFPSKELLTNQKVISLPHLGASTDEAEENCAVMISEQVIAFLEHGTIKNSVNFPEVEMPRQETYRLSVTNSNVPSMVAQISQILANHKLNIIDLVNKSKAEVAYSLIDLDAPINDKIIKQIESIDGVLNVRGL